MGPSASCGSTRSRCARSAGTTWPTTSPTGSRLADGTGAKLPKIFYVNWFRKNSRGEFLWPGYGENSRVLAWIFRRCDNDASARATPIGLIPAPADLDLSGLELAPSVLDALLEVDDDAVRAELTQIGEFLAQFGERLPAEFRDQLARLAHQVTGERVRTRDRFGTNRVAAVPSATTSTG